MELRFEDSRGIIYAILINFSKVIHVKYQIGFVLSKNSTGAAVQSAITLVFTFLFNLPNPNYYLPPKYTPWQIKESVLSVHWAIGPLGQP